MKHIENPMQANILDQINLTLKYISVKMIIDEKKIVKPKFAQLNFVLNLYDVVILYTRTKRIIDEMIGSVNFPISSAVLILASSFGWRKLIIVAKSRI